MSLSLLFGARKPKTIGELELDATIQETHEYQNDVTEYPVEDGSTLSDNIRLAPERVTISGFVTNTPVSVIQENKAEVVEKFDGTVEVKNLKRDEVNNNVEFALDVLLRIAGRKIDGADSEPELVTIVTGLRVYTDMAMTTLNIPRDATTGQALKFDASFVKIKKVNTETIELPNADDPDRAGGTVDTGQNTAPKANANQTAKTNKSSHFFNLLFN